MPPGGVGVHVLGEGMANSCGCCCCCGGDWHATLSSAVGDACNMTGVVTFGVGGCNGAGSAGGGGVGVGTGVGVGVLVGVTARGDIATNCIACGAGTTPKLLGGTYPTAGAKEAASSSCTFPLFAPRCAWKRLVSIELL